jgi:carbonic anhydrase
MTEADRGAEFARIIAENRRYAAAFDRSALSAAPSSRLVVVACMDARLDVREALGLRTGEAHILRNAGGLVTDDVVRSLIISRELLGTQEIVLIQHTGCGLLGVDEEALRDRVAQGSDRLTEATDIAFGGFDDLEENVRRQVAILREHPYLGRVPVHGLVFDVSDGRLFEVA